MRRDRIMVTVSPEMRAALYLLATKAGVVEATQATITLRQALDRTINSEDCRTLLSSREAFSTVKQWRENRAADREIDLLMEKASTPDAPPQAPAQLPAALANTPRRGTRKIHPVAAAPITDEPLYYRGQNPYPNTDDDGGE